MYVHIQVKHKRNNRRIHTQTEVKLCTLKEICAFLLRMNVPVIRLSLIPGTLEKRFKKIQKTGTRQVCYDINLTIAV